MKRAEVLNAKFPQDQDKNAGLATELWQAEVTSPRPQGEVLMAASIIARVDCRDNTKEAWWHACPEDVDAYRIVLLEEENRLRPWMEILFCQLRAEEESDEMLASRLSRFVALWAEQDGATDRGSRFSSRTLRTALRGLSPRSRTILLLHYRGMTQRAIAQRYGLSCQRVSQIIQTALRQAKKIIVQENNI